jgi:hypothetical protein
MDSFERGEVVRGREIINALPQEVKDLFRKLQIQQKTARTKTTNIINQTKSDLKHEESNRKTKMHETFVKSMLAARSEQACQLKIKLDDIHIEIIGIIHGINTDPEEDSPQGVACEEYADQFKEQWEEYQAMIREFREFLAQENDKFGEEQEAGTEEGRANSLGRQPNWRPKIGMDPGAVVEDITKGEWRIYLEKFDSYAIASTEDGDPTETFMRNAISSKLDTFWYERVTQATGKKMKECSFKEITEEITKTLSVRYPETTAQADLFRICKPALCLCQSGGHGRESRLPQARRD